MRTVLQRVERAAVRVDDRTVGAIGAGVLLLVGVEATDTEADAVATAEKVARMRIFPGATPMDRTLADVGGSCLVVSQFTIPARIRKGNRPSFTSSMEPGRAETLYLLVADTLKRLGLEVATGEFGASMAVDLVNDGPVTFLVFTQDGKVVDP